MTLQTYAQLATLDLSGTWRFQTDPMGFGMTPGSELYLSRLAETMSLPGTMDEGGKGFRMRPDMSTVCPASLNIAAQPGISGN